MTQFSLVVNSATGFSDSDHTRVVGRARREELLVARRKQDDLIAGGTIEMMGVV